MNIVYMGTPDFACVPLEALVRAGHCVSLVLTQPDKPKGRGNKMQKSPVKIKAEELGIRVLDPVKLKDNEECIQAIRQAQPDFIVAFAYGKILRKEILEIPTYGCLNIHTSLLPAYRGAAPVQRSIMDGCEYTGVTLMRMSEGLDDGDYYLQEKTLIGEKTADQLFAELAQTGARLLVDNIEGIAAGSVLPIPQGETTTAYAATISKEEGRISWDQTVFRICRLVQAFHSNPCAWTCLGDTVLKIHKVQKCSDIPVNAVPGTVISADKKGIEVACADGTARITMLQAPGKKAMDASAFLLGNKIEIGTVLR